MWHHVVCQMGTNVSKKPAAYIFRVSEEAVRGKLDDMYRTDNWDDHGYERTRYLCFSGVTQVTLKLCLWRVQTVSVNMQWKFVQFLYTAWGGGGGQVRARNGRGRYGTCPLPYSRAHFKTYFWCLKPFPMKHIQMYPLQLMTTRNRCIIYLWQQLL